MHSKVGVGVISDVGIISVEYGIREDVMVGPLLQLQHRSSSRTRWAWLEMSYVHPVQSRVHTSFVLHAVSVNQKLMLHT